ncbi:hypothetical protein FY846_004031 [Salmonella enterica subsp. enterica]|nr:hypothetical protein [Salmonella enterica subsp. enterica]EGI5138954.1 hypothetical protein [Salmonella enterica subsp. enterica]
MNNQHVPYFVTYFSTNSVSETYTKGSGGVYVGTNPVAPSVRVPVAVGGTFLSSPIKLNNCVTLQVISLSASVGGHFGVSPVTTTGPLSLDYPNMYGVHFGSYFTIKTGYLSEITGQTIVNYRLTRSCNDDSGTKMVYLRAGSLLQDKALARLGCAGCAIPLPPMKQNSCTASSSSLRFDFGTVSPGSRTVLNQPETKTITLTCTEPLSGTLSSIRAGKTWNMDDTLKTENYDVSISEQAEVKATIMGARRSGTEYTILMVPELLAKAPGNVDATDVLTIKYN